MDAILAAAGTPGSVVQRMMEAQVARATKQEQMQQMMQQQAEMKEEHTEGAAGLRNGPARAGFQGAREPDRLRSGECGRKEEFRPPIRKKGLHLRPAVNYGVGFTVVS